MRVPHVLTALRGVPVLLLGLSGCPADEADEHFPHDTPDLSLADAKFIGEEGGDHAGGSISAAGDVNGDGYDDLFVGAADHDTGDTDAGAAYLVLGPVSGTVDLSAADAKIVGECANDRAGGSISAGGDINDDGYGDLLVGACGQEAGGDTRGAAYLVHGPVSGIVDLSYQADAKFVGEENFDWACHVSDAGDTNGDGYDDIITGATGHDAGGTNAGAAYLVLGPVSGRMELASASAKLVGERPGDRAGGSVSSAGDVDGDGVDDLLIGASGHPLGSYATGAAYLVLSPVAGTVDLSDADAKLVGEEKYDGAGGSVSGAGDINGDGYDDLLIGAGGHESADGRGGAAYVVLGPVSGTMELADADAKIVGEVFNDGSVGGGNWAGDINGDGHEDILVGSSGYDEGDSEGAVFLLFGPVSGTVNLSSADAKFVGEAEADRVGAVCGAGDVNKDGYDDVLVGAYRHGAGGGGAGAAYLLLGGPDGP